MTAHHRGLTAEEGVHLTSAAVQVVADAAGVRVLHLKGPAAALVLGVRRSSSDVDVLAHPADLRGLVTALGHAGFTPDRPEWAARGHSVDLVSPVWPAAVDLHRAFPGMVVDAGLAFELLWSQRVAVTLGGIGCATPGRVAHALVIGLHAARSPRGSRKWAEAGEVWDRLTPEERHKVDELAQALGARAALGVRWPAFAGYATPTTAAVWTAMAERDAEALWWVRSRELRGPRQVVGHVAGGARAYLWGLRRRHPGRPVAAAREAVGKVARMAAARRGHARR